MDVIAVVNQKGGATKSSVAANLAAELAARDRSVIAIDLDPQNTLTTWTLGPVSRLRGTAEVLGFGGEIAGIAQLLIESPQFECHVLAASFDSLRAAENLLAGDASRQLALAQAISELPVQPDYIILDCPPNLGPLTMAGLFASTSILVPFDSSPQALHGFVELDAALTRARKMAPFEILGAVLSRFEARTQQSQGVLAALKTRTDYPLYLTIREATSVGNSFFAAAPIRRFAPESGVHQDYRAAAEAVERVLRPELEVASEAVAPHATSEVAS
jgi:chromosome partitioning protein